MTACPAGGIGLVLSGLLTVPAFLIYYGWVYREPLLQRFGTRDVAAPRRGHHPARLHRTGTGDTQRAAPNNSQIAALEMLCYLARLQRNGPSYEGEKNLPAIPRSNSFRNGKEVWAPTRITPTSDWALPRPPRRSFAGPASPGDAAGVRGDRFRGEGRFET